MFMQKKIIESIIAKLFKTTFSTIFKIKNHNANHEQKLIKIQYRINIIFIECVNECNALNKKKYNVSNK